MRERERRREEEERERERKRERKRDANNRLVCERNDVRDLCDFM